MGFRERLNELEIACSSFDDGKSYEDNRSRLQRFSDWYFKIRPFEERIYKNRNVRTLVRLFSYDEGWFGEASGESVFSLRRGESTEKLVEATKKGEKEFGNYSLLFTLIGSYVGYRGDIRRAAILFFMNLFFNYATILSMRFKRNDALKFLEEKKIRDGK